MQLIYEYHIPFIFFQYSPNNLDIHDVDKRKFFSMLENNGYKISIKNFLDKEYISIDELLQTKNTINLYIVYKKIFE